MTREIEFRAWHKKASGMTWWDVFKKFFYGEEIAIQEKLHVIPDYPNESISLDKGIKTYHYRNGPHMDIFNHHEWEVMQYTGIKDKNGKMIFEGDIVKRRHHVTIDYVEDIDTIIFNDGCFWLRNCRHDLWLSVNEIEVIGNLHENPELIKQGVEK